MSKLTRRWKTQKRSLPWKQQKTMGPFPATDTGEASSQKETKLSEWGLPPAVVESYRTKGMVSMFPWQAECLLQGRALSGGNLVYSAPTSAGKTLVAEILVLKCILERPGKKALFILPFVSLAREKMAYFQGMFGDSGVRVDGYMGSHHPPGGLTALDIAVCTIEKANGLVNHMLEDSKSLDQLGILVVDELHLVGDSHRGYLLELLLTKVLFSNLQRNEEERTQVIGMSATLPNLETLAQWLRADVYSTDFRPVPLKELVKVGPELLERQSGGRSHLLRRLDCSPLQFHGDPDHTIQLALEPVLAGGHGVLIFCPTKNWCEQLAQNLAKEIYRLGSLASGSNSSELAAGRRLREVLNPDRLKEILDLLRRTPAGLDDILFRTVAFGVGFHHAGLTMEERDVLEAGFRAGHLKHLVATSTLSSGVNLPARRVLIRSPHFRGNSLDILSYRQMAGRAGRKGADTQGESILLCKENERAAAEALIGAEMQPVESCLLQANGDLSSSLKRAILEVVASGVAKETQDVRQYMTCTLLASSVSTDQKVVTAAVDSCVHFLQDHEFITIGRDQEELHPTKLGQAVLASSLSPDEGLRVFSELQQARQCFVLDSDLHLIYQVTPPYVSDLLEQIDWLHYMGMWERLPLGQRRVGELVGIEERFLARCVRGQSSGGPRQKRLLAIHRRFYAALALSDLVSEVPLHEVASKYCCGRGLLQTLQQSASTFAGMVTVFCGRLGWSNLEVLLSHFQSRLHHGAATELCSLLRLPSLTARLARQLYSAGITSASDLATSDPTSITHVLRNSAPFHSDKLVDGDTSLQTRQKRESKKLYLTGNSKAMTEAEVSELLVKEARGFIQKELGVQIQNWNQKLKMPVPINAEKKLPLVHESSPSLLEHSNHLELSQTDQGLEKSNNLEAGRNIRCTDTIEQSSQISSPSLLERCDHLEPSQIDQATKQRNDSDTIRNIKHSYMTELSSQISSPSLLERRNHLEPSQTDQDLEQRNDSESGLNSFDEGQHDNLGLNQTGLEQSRNSESVTFQSERPNTAQSNQNILFPQLSNNLQQNPSKGQLSILDSEPNNRPANSQSEDVFDTTKVIPNRINPESLAPFQSQNEDESSTQLDNGSSQESDADKCRSKLFNVDSASPNPSQLFTSLTAAQLEENFTVSSQLNVSAQANISSIVEFEETLVIDSQTDHLLANVSPQVNESALRKSSRESLLLCDSFILPTQEFERMIQPVQAKNDLGVHKDVQSEDIFRKESQTKNPPVGSEDMFESFSAKVQASPPSSPLNLVLSELSDEEPQPDKNENGDASKDLTLSSFTTLKPFYPVEEDCNGTPLRFSTPKRPNPSQSSSPRKKPRMEEDMSPFNECISPTPPRETKPTQRKLFTAESSLFSSSSSSDGETEIPLQTSSRLTILDVCSDPRIFKTFNKEWKKQKLFALAVARASQPQSEGQGIGGKFKSAEAGRPRPVAWPLPDGAAVVGVALVWRGTEVNYLDLQNSSDVATSLRVDALREMLTGGKTGIAGNWRAHWLALLLCGLLKISNDTAATWKDPQLAAFLLDPHLDDFSLPALVHQYLPHMDLQHSSGSSTPRVKAAVEACHSYHLMAVLQSKLDDRPQLAAHFADVEMTNMAVLTRMEFSGFGLDSTKARQLGSQIAKELTQLTNQATQLAGSPFNMASPLELRRVLYDKLQLPDSNGRRSTSKETLESLQELHELPGTVLHWRKLSTTLKRVIQPLLRQQRYCPESQMYRVHGQCEYFTATGRVSMQEPNIQCVPRDFNILPGQNLCLREIFIARSGCVLVAADYSQLELRMLAHLSSDSALIDVLNRGTDVFVAVASRWKNKEENMVTDTERQHAKQICYGIIYGMGLKTLAAQLGVTEKEALQFMTSFKSAYPTSQRFLRATVDKCRAQGYVETIGGRHRPLPGLSSNHTATRSAAERQAINTLVQGSAADLVKLATVAVQRSVDDLLTSKPGLQAHLVLQLHDELVWEVSEDLTQSLAAILRTKMENAMIFSVRLPVNLRMGPAWGQLCKMAAG